MDINYFSISSLILMGLFIFSLFVSSRLLSKMNLMDEDAARRNSPLDGLRGVLASAVVVHHFYINYVMYTTGEWVRPTTQILNNFGAVSVSFFFLITGYLFFLKYRKVIFSGSNFICLEFVVLCHCIYLYLFLLYR